ncbi:MAG TPA: Rieske 2Fe-2S domain-containing protein [Conexibacter sp.]|jgi:nitrite reductase (NADH) small subunit|nr:Rieske 2Fe-2S domain-containing protein [Conexibacter sp.]
MTALADTWIEVGRAADVPLWEGRRVTIDGRRIAIFRTDEGFHAVSADCPHAGGPLQDGLVADGCVTCPLHGRRFDLRSGQRIGGGDDELTVHDVVERDGVLLLNRSSA